MLTNGSQPSGLHQFVADTAQMHRGYTKVGGDVMLGDALYPVGAILQEVAVSLFRRVPYKRQEFPHIMQLSLKKCVDGFSQDKGIMAEFPDHEVKAGFLDHVDLRGLNGFDGKDARDLLKKALR